MARAAGRRAGVLLSALIAVAAILAAPADARADKKRIVVLEFSGPGGPAFQRDVAAIIEGRHSVVPADRYEDTADELGAARPTPANLSRVASRLNVDGVVVGSIERRRGWYTYKVRLRAGRSGKFVKTVTVKARQGRLPPGGERKIRRQLMPAIADLPPVVVDEGPDEVDEVVEEEELVEDVVEDGGGGDDDPIELSAERKADLMARGRGLELAGGASFSARTLTFSYDSDLADDAPQGYRGTTVAGGYLVGELYPLAFDMKKQGATRNLGVTGVYDQVLKIESRLRYVDGMGDEMEAVLPTEQVRWGVGVVYRHNFGNAPDSPTVKLSVRYNRFRFAIDREPAPEGVEVDIPDVDYTYFDPGLAIRYPLSAKLAVKLDGRYILATAIGQMQEDEHYGAATVTGFDADAGIEYLLGPRLSIRAGGRYTRIAFDFDGTGELTTGRDGDPDQDVFGALDAYLGGYLTAGYLF